MASHGITVLTLRGAEISELTCFLAPEMFGRFGLPEVLEG